MLHHIPCDIAPAGAGLTNSESGGWQSRGAHSEYDNFPAWSPKRDLIEFMSFRDGDFEIYTVKPDGSGVRRLTHTGGNDAHGIWSPDGEWIVFSSSRLGWKDEALVSDYGPQP